MVKNVLYVNKLKNIKNNENERRGNPTKLLNYPLKTLSNWVRQSRGTVIATDRSKYLGFLDAKVSLITVFGFDHEVLLKNRYLLEVEISINFTNSLGLELIS